MSAVLLSAFTGALIFCVWAFIRIARAVWVVSLASYICGADCDAKFFLKATFKKRGVWVLKTRRVEWSGFSIHVKGSASHG